MNFRKTPNLIGLILFIPCIHFFAQNANIQHSLSVNSSGDKPDTTAIVDITSTEKGLLIPRMTTVQRDDISTPANGLIVYDTDLGEICHYATDHWKCIEVDVSECHTLDEAYDCSALGDGRKINVDAGAVYLDGSQSLNTILQVENDADQSVATFRDQLPGGIGTESLITLGQNGGPTALYEQFGGTTDVVHAQSTGTGRAGFFELTAAAGMGFTALEGLHRGNGHGAFGHTGVKDSLEGNFSIIGIPISGVVGLSSQKTNANRNGVSGVSLGNDGVYGKSFAGSSGISSVATSIGMKAGVKGTMESSATTNSVDFVGVLGNPTNNGIGVIGTTGSSTTTRGHGVFGVSGAYEATPSSSIGVWGVTREGRTWPALMAKFPYLDSTYNKVQVGVLGQSEKFVAVWGESLKSIGVIGTTAQQSTNADFGSLKAGVLGEADTVGIGVIGRAKGEMNAFAGVKAHGKADRNKASALHIHDGDIRVTKMEAADTPADRISITLTWNPAVTCPEEPGPHDHVQAFISNPVKIMNQYADAERSVILLTVESTLPGVSIQLKLVENGSFDVEVTLHSANIYCMNQPPPGPFKIHYMIINK
jgi:hypothetical protein